MRFIAKRVGHAEKGHLGNETFHWGCRGFGHRQGAALELFDTLGFGTELTIGENFQADRAARLFGQDFCHVQHCLMDGVILVEAVGQLEDGLAAGGFSAEILVSDQKGKSTGGDQQADEQAGDKKRGSVFVQRIAFVLGSFGRLRIA